LALLWVTCLYCGVEQEGEKKKKKKNKREEEAESRSVVSPSSLGDIGEQRGHAEATRSISIMEGQEGRWRT